MPQIQLTQLQSRFKLGVTIWTIQILNILDTSIWWIANTITFKPIQLALTTQIMTILADYMVTLKRYMKFQDILSCQRFRQNREKKQSNNFKWSKMAKISNQMFNLIKIKWDTWNLRQSQFIRSRSNRKIKALCLQDQTTIESCKWWPLLRKRWLILLEESRTHLNL